ncbi:MAG: hypothetical protein KDC49_20250 [Saprospiraceae bacterium]|nr:hypothetical protein [Saprospiraceae bacterium]
MKHRYLAIVLAFFSLHLFGGGDAGYTVEYSPANPTAGQQVTFTLVTEYPCEIERLAPDVNTMTLLSFPAQYTYATAGTYHVALDIEFDFSSQECIPAIRNTANNKRELVPNFQLGPVGGPYTPAVMLNGIWCAPITIAAPQPIPTMSQWVLINLFILISIIGVVFYMNAGVNSVNKPLTSGEFHDV